MLEAAFGGAEEVALVESLRKSDAWIPDFALVAIDADEVVGYSLTTRAHIEGEPVLALGPIGVHPSIQGKGIGSQLMQMTIDRAEAAAETLIGLLGEPGYYRRFGFVAASRAGVASPVDEWGEFFQVLRLSPAGPSGKFTYPSAFGV